MWCRVWLPFAFLPVFSKEKRTKIWITTGKNNLTAFCILLLHYFEYILFQVIGKIRGVFLKLVCFKCMFISKLGWRILVISIKLICNQKFCEFFLFLYHLILQKRNKYFHNKKHNVASCSVSGLIEKFHSGGFKNITRLDEMPFFERDWINRFINNVRCYIKKIE